MILCTVRHDRPSPVVLSASTSNWTRLPRIPAVSTAGVLSHSPPRRCSYERGRSYARRGGSPNPRITHPTSFRSRLVHADQQPEFLAVRPPPSGQARRLTSLHTRVGEERGHVHLLSGHRNGGGRSPLPGAHVESP